MNWKSTVLVSGAGVLATWFASAPVQHAPAPAERATVPTTGVAHESDEIVREAERLRARLHPPVAYQEPSRNPFQFGARRPAPAPRAPKVPEGEITEEPLTDAPVGPSLRVNLSGIAEDTVGGTTVRTAVISTQDDLLLVKEGDVIAGQYKVTSITATSVELTRVSDGSVVRLALRP